MRVLSEVTLPAPSTPQKSRYDYLYCTLRWRYRGPKCDINFDSVIGQSTWSGFDEITDHRTYTYTQQASLDWAEFELALPEIYLGKLSPRDEPYVEEIWMRSSAFSDIRVLVENAVKIIS